MTETEIVWSDKVSKVPDPMQKIFGRIKPTRPPLKPVGAIHILGKRV